MRASDVLAAGGKGLLRQHGSLFAALASTYPDMGLEAEVCRPQRPRGYWGVEENRRAFLADVARACNVATAAQWKMHVTRKRISDMGGRALLDRYPSLFAMLQENLPELDWAAVDWRTGDRRRTTAPRGHWDCAKNRREFLTSFAAGRGIIRAADWKAVTLEDLVEAGGGGLLSRYPSILAALNDILGQDWQPAECRPQAPKRYWDDAANVARFLRELKARFRVVTDEDWARLSREQVIEAGGRTLLERMGLVQALAMAEPEARWPDRLEGLQRTVTGSNKKSAQRWLHSQLVALFDGLSTK